jgi:hypothetical protein
MRAPRSGELAPGEKPATRPLWRVYILKRERKAQGAARKAQGSRTKAQGANKTKHRRYNLIVVDGKQLIYIKPMQLCILTKDKTQ